MSNKKRLLIIGGTGYLGQHLLQSISESQKKTFDFDLSMAFTHHSSSPPHLLLQSVPNSTHFQVDLQTGQGFDSISHTFGQGPVTKRLLGKALTGSFILSDEHGKGRESYPGKSNDMGGESYVPDVVVNCAALSVPRVCETNPTATMSVNVPSSLVKWLSSFTTSNTLLIHLSTDQVYEGTKSFYKEDDETLPVNVYGKSKVAAEEYIIANWSNFVILRSSIIFGPQTISPVSKSLPVQWMDNVLSKGQETEFFHDEFRCPVYVKDVVNIIQILSNRWISDGKKLGLLLNVGGPNRLSRVEMAEVVARVRGYDTSLIKPVSASSIDRGVKSPADISMDINKLIQTLDFTPTSFHDGVKLTINALT